MNFKMKKILITFTVLSLTGCCYYDSEIMLEHPNFTSDNKALVFENDKGREETLLRSALSKHGITVLKYTNSYKEGLRVETSYNTVDIKNNMSFTNKDKSPYLIELQKDYSIKSCLTSGTLRKYDITAEITDLRSNNVVFTARASGMEKKCGYCDEDVFSILALQIANFWSKQ